MMAVCHPEMGNVHMSIAQIGDDPDTQVENTIAYMRQYAIEDAATPEIRIDVSRACKPLGSQYDPEARCAALWRWVKNKIQFKQDRDLSAPLERAGLARHPVVEVLVRPIDISRGASAGDCDDFSMYLASLLTASGIPCSFVTVAADPHQPENFSHVYIAAYPNGRRIPLDSSHGEAPGWEVPYPSRIEEWPVTRPLDATKGIWA
jgi:hypothetical protein